jgi:hypothetical protein
MRRPHDNRTRDRVRDPYAARPLLAGVQDRPGRLALGGSAWVAMIVALVVAPDWVALACGGGLLCVALCLSLVAARRH